MKELLYKIINKKCERLDFLLTLIVLAAMCRILEVTFFSDYVTIGLSDVGYVVYYFLAFLIVGSLIPLIFAGMISALCNASVFYFLAMAILGLVYIIQGARRCKDMGVSPWRMLIPLYMPIALLTCKRTDTEIDNKVKRCLHEIKEGNYRKLNKMLVLFLLPKGRLSRKGFIYIFVCAIIAVEIFKYLTLFLWCLSEPWDFKVNLSISISELVGILGLITGFVPAVAFILVDSLYISVIWGYEVGYIFLVEAIVVSTLYVFYLFMCIKRCHDIGRSWFFCLIPFYNPFCLLIKKSKPLPKKWESLETTTLIDENKNGQIEEEK